MLSAVSRQCLSGEGQWRARIVALAALVAIFVPSKLPVSAHELARTLNYYVSPRGSDSSAGTRAHPFRTINKGVSVLRPGATLWVMPGTYREYLDKRLPSGTGWTRTKSGGPVTVRAAELAHRPVLLSPHGPVASCANLVCCAEQRKETGRATCFHGDGIHIESSERYIIFDGLVIDARHVQRNAFKIKGGANHIRIENSTLMRAPLNGMLITDGSDYNQMLNLDVYGNGGSSAYNHGIYLDSSDNVVEGSRIHDNSGWGVHVYNGSPDPVDHSNLIVDNEIYRNGLSSKRGAGIGLYSGPGQVAFDNVLWGNYHGIQVAYGATEARIYNNTVMSSVGYGIYVFVSAPHAQVVNNIVVKSGVAGVRTDSTSTTIRTNDLFENSKDVPVVPVGQPAPPGNLVGTDPRLRCINCANPSLLARSPAIWAGTRLPRGMPLAPGGPRRSDLHPNIGAYRG